MVSHRAVLVCTVTHCSIVNLTNERATLLHRFLNLEEKSLLQYPCCVETGQLCVLIVPISMSYIHCRV